MNNILVAQELKKELQSSTEPQPLLGSSAPVNDRNNLLSQMHNERKEQGKALLDLCSPLSALSQLYPPQLQQITDAMAQIRRSETLTNQQKEDIIQSLIVDITKPEKVNQGLMATCVPTTVQHQFAATDPVQYTLMIRDLAVKGSFSFKDPENTSYELNRQTLQEDAVKAPPPFEKRSVTERMVQDILMRYAVGDKIKYDNLTDTSRGEYQGQQVTFKGLCKDHIERMVSGLSGKKFARLDNNNPGSTDDVIKSITNNAKTAGGTLVELRWSSSGDHQLHMLMVKEINGDHVTLFNPHGAINPPAKPGAIQHISLNDFRNKLSCAFLSTEMRNDGLTSRVPDIQRPLAEPQAQHPLANQEGVIEFHISPNFVAQPGSQNLSSKLTLADISIKANPVLTEPTVSTIHNGNPLPDGAASAATQLNSQKPRLKSFYRPTKSNSDDDDLI